MQETLLRVGSVSSGGRLKSKNKRERQLASHGQKAGFVVSRCRARILRDAAGDDNVDIVGGDGTVCGAEHPLERARPTVNHGGVNLGNSLASRREVRR